MNAEKEKGLAPTAAPEKELHQKSCRACVRESSSKLQIGEFLLYLSGSSNRGKCFWGHLEAELRGRLA